MSIENAVASTDLKHLTRQFYSAKALIISQQETIKHYSQKDFDTNERRIKALQYSLGSEREMNANLTAELAELESKCEKQARCNKELDKELSKTKESWYSSNRRIAELEKERDALLDWQKDVYSLSAYLVFHESNSDATMVKAKKLLEQRDLEQQAKGVESLISTCETIEQHRANRMYRQQAKVLRNQAAKLKEGEL